MANAAVDIEKVRDALLGHEGANILVVLGEFFVGRRHTMVKDDDVPVGIVNPGHADLLESLGDRRGVVVTHGDIGLDLDDLAGNHAFARLVAKNLFCKTLSHAASLPVEWVWLTNYNKSK